MRRAVRPSINAGLFDDNANVTARCRQHLRKDLGDGDL